MIRYRQLGKILDARSPDAYDAFVAGRVRHRVDRTDDQVKNDLLKLDAIADNWKCNRSDAGLIRLAPFGIQGVSDLRLKNSRNRPSITRWAAPLRRDAAPARCETGRSLPSLLDSRDARVSLDLSDTSPILQDS